VIRWLGSLPAGVLFVAIAAVWILGTIVLDLVMRRVIREEVRGSAANTAATTLLALATVFAIIVAFVIVDAYSQVSSAQDQVSDKAAELSVVSENSRAFPGDEGREVRTAVRTYAGAVVDRALPQIEESAQPSIAADRALEALYAGVREIAPATTAETAAYEQINFALSNITRTRSRLIDLSRPSVPDALIWILVVLGAAVLALAAALDTRDRRSHLVMLSVMSLSVSLSLALVLSLNYPFDSLIGIDAQPLREIADIRSAR
jgi:lysylphosphatidylglycerol synthetase-like protein (DUF2156 family)